MDVAGTGTDAQLAGRIKQWLSYLRRRWPQATPLLEKLKRETRPEVISRILTDFVPLT